MLDSEMFRPNRSAKELPAVNVDWAAAHRLHYQFLANQQLMLEDRQRTRLYREGILANRQDFEGKVVLDVGAGTGILSIFAAQAGAKRVYAVEASGAAMYARKLVAESGFADQITVIHDRLEHVELPCKVDLIVSEPWGFFLFHERMVEVLVEARERFLKPDGKVFPRHASVWVAPFEDAVLHDARCQRVAFWDNHDFLGVDLTPLADTAYEELFEMPALGPMSPERLLAEGSCKLYDFNSVTREQLARIQLPFEFCATRDGLMHGLAGWFDVTFEGSHSKVVLSTAPDQIPTHWAQMRFLFRRPLELRKGERFEGELVLTANASSSYDAVVQGHSSGGLSLEPHRFRLQNYFSWDGDE